jgi:hypothetical protein
MKKFRIAAIAPLLGNRFRWGISLFIPDPSDDS